jgi:von Willebrand factor type A domain/FG-GAP-like repeat
MIYRSISRCWPTSAPTLALSLGLISAACGGAEDSAMPVPDKDAGNLGGGSTAPARTSSPDGGSLGSPDTTAPGVSHTSPGASQAAPASLCIEAKPVSVVPPAGLQARFRVVDCDGNPVRPVEASDVSVINDEKGVPFGQGGEGDSVSGVGQNSNIELYSVLVLDLSNSIHDAGALDAVIDGARAFVKETVTTPPGNLKHNVAIIAFGRPSLVTLEADFTQDDTALNAKLEELREGPPRGTTDLYGAYQLALDIVSATGTDTDAVVERFVVLLTDGTHEAGDEANLRKQALAAKHATNATIFTMGIQGTYDACRLEELAGRGGSGTAKLGCREEAACTGSSAPASCTQFFPGVSQTAIDTTFQNIAQRAVGLARSNYVVGICTPVSLGNPTLTIKVDVDGVSDEVQTPYAVAGLDGDVNACDAAEIQQGTLACDDAGLCQVVCLNKECGLDQGVSCGSCGAKQVCADDQTCEDVCVGKTCGTDQGVACGTCTGTKYCGTEDTCIDPCEDMSCGTDHGLECGECTGSDYCDEHACKASCEDMSCGVDHGFACGECGSGEGCDPSNQCVECGPPGTFDAPESYAVTTAGDVAVADFNDDGTLDIAVADYNEMQVRVWLNLGKGVLDAGVDYPTGGEMYELAVGDIDGDGMPDLALGGGSDIVNVLLNDGNGGFEEPATYNTGRTSSRTPVLADLTGDDKPELILSNPANPGVIVFVNLSDGTFAEPVGYGTFNNGNNLATVDLDGDGYLDVLSSVAVYPNGAVRILSNQGDGTLEAVDAVGIPATGGYVAAADVTGDEAPDIVVLNNSHRINVWPNDGTGAFVDYTHSETGATGEAKLALGDVNNDGNVDAVVVGTALTVQLGLGDGTFDTAVGYPTSGTLRSIVLADLDEDGKLDIVASGGEAVFVYRNRCLAVPADDPGLAEE